MSSSRTRSSGSSSSVLGRNTPGCPSPSPTPLKKLEAFLAGHVAAFEFFGGCPQRLVPDNLGSGVLRPDLYDPRLNRGYSELAHHYGCLVDPGRVAHPKDKPRVERIVPYVRGDEKNRAPEQVLDEVRRVVAEGIPEVVLLGQTVNSYEHGDWDFPRLLREVARVDGVRRVRFLEPMTAVMLANHRRIAPFGLHGGKPGALGRNWVERTDGTREEFGATCAVAMRAGDVFVIETPGGGGFGPP